MMQILLPVLSGETELRDAMSALRVAHRSALITMRNGVPVLIKASAIVHGVNEARRTLEELPGLGVAFTTGPTYDRFASKPFGLDQFQEVFAQSPHNYAISIVVADSALVVTRHEGIGGQAEAAPQDCYCTNDDEHPVNFGPPPHCTMCTWKVDCI
jgi:hypothetical protein